MEIKRAEDKDIPEMANLMLEEFSKPPYNEVASFENVIKSLDFYLDIGSALIALEGLEIVGILVYKEELYWQGRVFIVEDLAVKDPYKDKGVGKALVKQLEKFALNKEIKSILLNTHKRSSAIGFYEKVGFNTEDRIFFKKALKA